jgi:hypothetical protein
MAVKTNSVITKNAVVKIKNKGIHAKSKSSNNKRSKNFIMRNVGQGKKR